MLFNSLWLDTAYPREHYPAVTADLKCDVCIVGGGLNGLANAYFLAKEGKNVILVEKEMILEGATGNTTGKLTVQHDLVYADLIKHFGREGARTYYEVNDESIRFAASLSEGDEFRLADSILFSNTEHGTKQLQDEKWAYDELGIPGELGWNSELPIKMDATLTIAHQGQLHSVRFGQHLAELAVKAGAKIYEHSDVRSMDLKKRLLFMQSSHVIEFSELVLCTHYPIEALRGLQVMKLVVDRSYLVSAKADMPLKGQYLSVDQPKRSIRTVAIDGRTYFLLGGESHKAGMEKDTQPRYDKLAHELRSIYNLETVTNGWSAQDPSTPDLVPYAGPIDASLPYVYINTGFRKWGMSNSLAAARIVSDHIVGRENKAAALYAPSRTNFGSFMVQALRTTGLVIKEFAGGHLTRTDSPICTHMGCRTRWNAGDETWDCPCHGSRFRKDGSVLEGPATRPLDLP